MSEIAKTFIEAVFILSLTQHAAAKTIYRRVSTRNRPTVLRDTRCDFLLYGGIKGDCPSLSLSPQ